MEAVRQGHSEALAGESRDPSSRPGGTQDDNFFLPGACPELAAGPRMIMSGNKGVVGRPQ